MAMEPRKVWVLSVAYANAVTRVQGVYSTPSAGKRGAAEQEPGVAIHWWEDANGALLGDVDGRPRWELVPFAIRVTDGP